MLPGCGASYDGSVGYNGGHPRLTFAAFPSLAKVGGGAIVDVQGSFPIAVVRTAVDTAVALSATCTHAGCLVEVQGSDLFCNCHEARFAFDGRVLGGPTNVNLPTYPCTVDSDGISVDVTG